MILYKTVWCVSKYYEDDKFRIFSIANLEENTLLLEKACIRPTDKFLVLLTWMHTFRWFKRNMDFIKSMNFDESNFYLMCNTQTQFNDARTCGFSNVYLINRHFVLHPGYYKVENTPKIYDVCVYGEHFQRNRINYSFHIPNLALIDAAYRSNSLWEYPACAYRNTEFLGEDHLIIQSIMRQSYTGLCLAQAESICQSSVEFLFNGIPVVTTSNDTGRMEWFDEHNSIIIPDINPYTITNAVHVMKDRVLSGDIHPELIRERAIAKTKMYGKEFRVMVSDIFNRMGVPDISRNLINTKYEHHFLYQKHWKNFEDTLNLFK